MSGQGEQCRILKQVAAEMLACKKRGASAEEANALLMKGLVCLTEIKAANRTLCEETERVRDLTAEAKAQFDTAELSLQNLLYEKRHYLKEIRACKAYRSKYSDEEIGLMPEEEFLATAPEQFKEGIEDDHKRMLQRLDHEKYERGEAVKRVQALQMRRDALANNLKNKQDDLERVEQQFAAVRATAEPMREKLGIPAMRRPPGQVRCSALLPLPLYVAYVQLAAAQEAFDLPADVSIAGSLAEAEALASRPGDGASAADAASEAGGMDVDEDAEDADTETDLEPGEHRPVKRPRSAGATALDQAHPLMVIVKLSGDSGSSGALTLRLHYIPRLKLVTADCAEATGSARLARLFDGDDGLTVPTEAAHLAAGGQLSWEHTRSDRPYRWAQDLAGLDLLPPLDALGSGADGAAIPAGRLPDLRRKANARAVLERLSAR
ncbi:g3847 [Coccomyxa elongata]